MIFGGVKIKGKLIVLEGTDSSGKTTQYNKLIKKLESEGKEIVRYHFPKHGNLFGEVVDDYLMGKFGNKEDLAPEFIAMLYMTDFYNSKKEMEEVLSQGKHIVLSRFFSSTLTYQVALTQKEKREEVWEWIRKVCSLLPQPDLTLVLTVAPEISQKLLNNSNNAEAYKKGATKDQHENDIEFQKNVFNEYMRNINLLNWKKIDCVENDSLLPIDIISEKVYVEVKKIIDN
jgi:dTMP kinase